MMSSIETRVLKQYVDTIEVIDSIYLKRDFMRAGIGPITVWTEIAETLNVKVSPNYIKAWKKIFWDRHKCKVLKKDNKRCLRVALRHRPLEHQWGELRTKNKCS